MTLELAETFVIARESSDTVDLVEVEIRHDGLVGYGEAAPIERYGETVSSATAWLEEAGPLLGNDPWALDEIHARMPEVSRRPARPSTQRFTTSARSRRACRSTGSSALGRRGRTRRGPSGWAIPTTWRGAQRRSRAGSGG